MDLFEYQGKELLRKFDVPVPEGRVATTPDEAAEAAKGLGGKVVVKAQVQVGGRGKAGGIKLAGSPKEARDVASRILGMDIKGHTVKRVLVERAGDIKAEYYCSFLLDRSNRNFLGMMSAKGGVDIEEVADTDPDAIAMVHIDPLLGMSDFHAREMVFGAQLDPEARKDAIALLPKLYRAFTELDASLVEVNPLILTGEGRVVALDAKVSLDDSAFYRHPSFEQLKAAHEIPEQERVAKEKGLNFIKLDGDVGIIGNGAGLVMSTLDVVKAAGGEAANFLDVGGGAGAELLSSALEVITSNPEVKSVLINIFGGITRCDLVAEGIIDALARLDVKVPIVVRLDGTNAEQGRKMLADAPHPMLKSSDTMLGAAQLAVDLSKGGAGSAGPPDQKGGVGSAGPPDQKGGAGSAGPPDQKGGVV